MHVSLTYLFSWLIICLSEANIKQKQIFYVICSWYFADNDENDSWHINHSIPFMEPWKLEVLITATSKGSLVVAAWEHQIGRGLKEHLKFLFIWLHHILWLFSLCLPVGLKFSCVFIFPALPQWGKMPEDFVSMRMYHITLNSFTSRWNSMWTH